MDSVKIKVPNGVIDHRQRVCQGCDCEIDFTSHCLSCPKGKWSRFVLCEPPLPPVGRQLKNFAKASGQELLAILNNVAPVTEEEAQQHFAICQQCTFFRHSDKRCAHPDCGCFAKKKTAWRAQRCPDGKW